MGSTISGNFKVPTPGAGPTNINVELKVVTKAATASYLEAIDRCAYQVRVVMIKGSLNSITEAEVDVRSAEIINKLASDLGKDPQQVAEHVYAAFQHQPEEKIHALDVQGRPRLVH